MGKSQSKSDKTCSNCIHYCACSAWNVGSIANMDGTNCANYEKYILLDNPPLTESQIRERVGMPLYLKDTESSVWNGYIKIFAVDDDGFEYERFGMKMTFRYSFHQIGKSFNLFDHPPKQPNQSK